MTASSLYLDHASTSFPKDPRVIEEVRRVMEVGATPHRGAHRSAREMEGLVDTARERMARLLGVSDADRITFTLNATDALNAAIKGVVGAGDRVVTTQVEHNSVLRPLNGLVRRANAQVDVVAASAEGVVSFEALRQALEKSPARLLVISHASNVTGALQPVEEIGTWLRERNSPTRLLVDAAQTAGYRSLAEVTEVADFVAVAGHKGPGGPLGTGVLWTRADQELPPWREGGTGTDSETSLQPDPWPEHLEAGTPNLPGIAGLSEAASLRLEQGLEQVAERRTQIVSRFLDAVAGLKGVQVFGPKVPTEREPVFPIRVDGYQTSEAAVILETSFGIQQRSGLHCAPEVHRALGTAGEGTLRLSYGALSEESEVDRAVAALQALGS